MSQRPDFPHRFAHNSHINNIVLPISNLFTQTLPQKSKTMQGWLPLYCGDNWDLFTVKRKWIFTITARSRYRCSASPASISRFFSWKKLSYCMLKDMSFWNPIYVVFHSGFKLLKRAENRFTWCDFTNFSKLSNDSHNFRFRSLHSLRWKFKICQNCCGHEYDLSI